MLDPYGGNNTTFFHACANGQHRKSRICSLEIEREISNQSDIAAHVVEFYKQLFGAGELRGIHLEVGF
jgi:hypothetical protein